MRSIKANIHIIALLSLLAAVSCRERPIDTDNVLDVRVFSVSGTVYDASVEGGTATVAGATVVMTAYSIHDTDRTIPVYSASILTDRDGGYVLNKLWNENSSDVYYVFNVRDDNSLRTVHYLPEQRDLYMSPLSPFYHPGSRSYEVKGNDFFLFPESD